MGKFTLQHRPHAQYASAMATGIAIHGPLGDGLVHLTFYRDGARIVQESFDAEEEQTPIGTVLTVKAPSHPPEIEHFREDVATLLIPIDKFAGFADAMQRMATQLPGAPAQEGQ